MHGAVKAATKACKKLAKTLKLWDMVMNPDDPCVWNRDVDGKQLMLMFHACFVSTFKSSGSD